MGDRGCNVPGVDPGPKELELEWLKICVLKVPDQRKTGSVPRVAKGLEHRGPWSPQDGAVAEGVQGGPCRTLGSAVLIQHNYTQRPFEEMAAHSSVLAWRIPGTG